MRVLEEPADQREDTVRRNPYVVEATKIMETARNHLLAAVVSGDVAESRRLMDVFARAASLLEETEDGVRLRLGLLTQDEAARRAVVRLGLVPDAMLPVRRRGWRDLRRRQGEGDGHLQVIFGSTPT